jgi:hypothetical protein
MDCAEAIEAKTSVATTAKERMSGMSMDEKCVCGKLGQESRNTQGEMRWFSAVYLKMQQLRSVNGLLWPCFDAVKLTSWVLVNLGLLLSGSCRAALYCAIGT